MPQNVRMKNTSAAASPMTIPTTRATAIMTATVHTPGEELEELDRLELLRELLDRDDELLRELDERLLLDRLDELVSSSVLLLVPLLIPKLLVVSRLDSLSITDWLDSLSNSVGSSTCDMLDALDSSQCIAILRECSLDMLRDAPHATCR